MSSRTVRAVEEKVSGFRALVNTAISARCLNQIRNGQRPLRKNADAKRIRDALRQRVLNRSEPISWQGSNALRAPDHRVVSYKAKPVLCAE